MKKVNRNYFASYILKVAFRTMNIEENISHILYFVKEQLGVSDIIIYKMNSNGEYIHRFNQVPIFQNSSGITKILNSKKDNLERQDQHSSYVMFLPIEIADCHYVVAIVDRSKPLNLDMTLVGTFLESMQLVFLQLENINRLKNCAYQDEMTGLYNRNYYQQFFKDQIITGDIAYVLFDLFRLKYVNDTFGHLMGDKYIQEAAWALRNFFPMKCECMEEFGRTFDNPYYNFLFRIGGDEFVLISKDELQEIKSRILSVQKQVESIRLVEGVNIPLAIDYGLATGDIANIDSLYQEADKKLDKQKTLTYQSYQKYGITRRT